MYRPRQTLSRICARATCFIATALIGVLFTIAPSEAKLCGDDVDGVDVPCDCGDTVVSDVALEGDPVTRAICQRNGLVVRTPQREQGVTIDLRGATLRGSGQGTGIWVQHGGGQGARLISSAGGATVSGFRDGIVSLAGVALVDGIDVRGCRRDGLRLGGMAYSVRNIEVEDTGRDGFSLRGEAFQVQSTRAVQNGRYGYHVQGREAVIGVAGTIVRAERSVDAGFHLMGSGHRLEYCMAAATSGDGVHLHATNVVVQSCLLLGNKRNGMSGMVDGGWFQKNRAIANGNNGILVRGGDIVDAGGNSGYDNRGKHQPPDQEPVQCELDGFLCAPLGLL